MYKKNIVETATTTLYVVAAAVIGEVILKKKKRVSLQDKSDAKAKRSVRQQIAAAKSDYPVNTRVYSDDATGRPTDPSDENTRTQKCFEGKKNIYI